MQNITILRKEQSLLKGSGIIGRSPSSSTLLPSRSRIMSKTAEIVLLNLSYYGDAFFFQCRKRNACRSVTLKFNMKSFLLGSNWDESSSLAIKEHRGTSTSEFHIAILKRKTKMFLIPTLEVLRVASLKQNTHPHLLLFAYEKYTQTKNLFMLLGVRNLSQTGWTPRSWTFHGETSVSVL